MCHLKALERKGLISRSPNKSRAIELNDGFKEPKGLPMLGHVSAGLTQLADEQSEQLSFEELFPRKTSFALRVRGDSMIEAQINDGDYVIVHVGFAIQRLDEAEAQRTLSLLDELAANDAPPEA